MISSVNMLFSQTYGVEAKIRHLGARHGLLRNIDPTKTPCFTTPVQDGSLLDSNMSSLLGHTL